MSEKFEVGDLVEIVDIEALKRYTITDGMRGAIGGRWEVTEVHDNDVVYVYCGKENGGEWVFSAKSLRKVAPEADPRKINIVSVQIRYRRQEGITNLLTIFTVGNSHVQAAVETTALCSTSDTFKKRTGRVVAMQRACDILGVTMREIAEKM